MDSIQLFRLDAEFDFGNLIQTWKDSGRAHSAHRVFYRRRVTLKHKIHGRAKSKLALTKDCYSIPISTRFVVQAHGQQRLDLLGLLPTVEVINGLIVCYFEYCNWIYRHVNQTASSRNWEHLKKNGVNSDHIILALARVQ
ncbi:hypothetical protein BT96DRAFT_350903 [Gymnopus androsaceus JB14]|uniref:Uncharacterized protein n=1 Tax=Gymnopus androsaceus JB14 TaxID=1447944 RepID=A0A6A4GZ22_9AGAR|nr:hypothetical protein BT96DRAFT_350903 [Gymnopus androsaceus JB14]